MARFIPPWATNKFRATPTVYNGVRYSSKAEAAYAEQLDLLVREGAIRWWLGQPKFYLGDTANEYRPDFLVVPPSERGVPYTVDVKGVETPKFKRDAKLWKEYGPCPLHVVKRKGTKFVTDRVIDPLGESQ